MKLLQKIIFLFLAAIAIVCCTDKSDPIDPNDPNSKTENQPNPHFQVYLCFGQSNMEGNAAIEDIDR